MTISLNHTTAHVADAVGTAALNLDVLELSSAERLAHFTIVQVGETSLDLIETSASISPRHFAFLVSESEFDDILVRIKRQGDPPQPRWTLC